VASLRLLLELGAKKSNILLLDRQGVVHQGRMDLNQYKTEFVSNSTARTLADAMRGADVFLGLSGPGLLTGEAVKTMAAKPVIFALSNPDPEIKPEEALAARSDLIMATGRSDYPNQVNNVLGFPFIFRGALDVRAGCINEAMKIAAVEALCDLTREPVPIDVLQAYGLQKLEFGPAYIIPKPLDQRLRMRVSSAVARAAVRSGVAQLDYPPWYPVVI
jgi:malate dehydrogenase (oxaloacetate-decarboxylating)(NADP+)